MFSDRHLVQFLAVILIAWPANAKGSPESIALSLTQFTNMALKNSLRSRIAEENLTSNRYSWMASRRGLTWPTLSASASENKTYSDNDLGTTEDTRQTDARFSFSQPFLTGTNLSLVGDWTRLRSETDTLGLITPSKTVYSPVWTAGFTQPIFVFTGNESLRSRREANLSWENSQDTYWKERLSIEFDARVQYYNLLLQSETANVQKKKLQSSQLVNNTTRALVHAGKLAEVELVRADIRARKDSRAIQNAENNLEQQMNKAKDLIFLPTNQTIRLASSLSYEPFAIPLNKLIRAANENNPDLQIARRQMELSEIELKRARERDHPQINTSGKYALTRDRSHTNAPLDPYDWTLSIGMDWPIFDASQTQLRKRQADITYQNAKRAYENQLRQLNVAVENAYLEIKRAEEQISDFGPQKESAERNVNAIRLQYRNGLTRLTDVFDAENQMLDLDLEYLGLLVTFNTARDGLKPLVGADINSLQQGK